MTLNKKLLIALVGSVIVVAAMLVSILAPKNSPEISIPSAGSNVVGMLVFVLIGFALYFVPSIIAVNRKHRQTGPIVAINVLAGWTFVGWVVAFAWALSAQDPKTS